MTAALDRPTTGLIDVAEARRRATNSEHYTGSRAPEAVRAWVRRRTIIVDGSSYVDTGCHAAFSELKARDVMADTVASLSQSKRAEVVCKLRAIQDFAAFMGGSGRTLGRDAGRKRFVRERKRSYTYRDGGRERVLRLSCRSLRRWAELYGSGGLDALARDGRGRWDRDNVSADAVALYWTIRNDKSYSIAHCHRQVCLEAEKRGWQWFKTYSACSAWDKRTRNDRALTLNHRGDLRYQQKSGAYIELDPESYAPGQCWVGDDHTLNVWVRLPNGKIVRPVLSAYQDWRSRVIVGFRVVQTGNEHSLLLAFSDGADAFGIPESVIADNGKNFISWQWAGGKPRRRVYRKKNEFAEQAEGIFALCGVKPSWCLPYNPNGKARLERWFRTLDEQFCKAFPSYCGKSPDDRPDAHVELVKRAVDWDVFDARLREYVRSYNARSHTGEGMGGLTPIQVMNTRERRNELGGCVQKFAEV